MDAQRSINVSKRMTQGFGSQEPYAAKLSTRVRQLHGLTEREAEVALLLLDGHKPAAIGETLGISVRGVRFHLKNCYAKLGVPGQAALVALLARRTVRTP